MVKKRQTFAVPPTARQRVLGGRDLARENELARDHHEAQELQRRQQQGLGNPIVSAVFKGQRFVAVGNALHHSARWRTFHDVLIDYGRHILGREWWVAESKKQLGERHPAVRWFELMHEAGPGPEGSAPLGRAMTGAAAAYLRLAYDLYCLKHNAEVRDRLVQRLKDQGNYPGSRYEVFVAAAFARAGFGMAFENEDDGTTSHCEFTATCKQTGRKFSVEAKHCAGELRIGRRLHGALTKNADHPRVVFIDVNNPDDGSSGAEMPQFMRYALDGARRFERSRPGRALPPAYLFMTNHAFPHHLDSTAFRSSFVVEGFHIPEFKGDAMFRSVREAVDARDAHAEMERLAKSMHDHGEVPATFDGDIPELAFSEGKSDRLRIGDRYLIPDGSGLLVPGTLETAAVMEGEGLAYGAYATDDGRRLMVSCPVTEDELAAYRRHPDTFFGVVQEVPKQLSNPVDLYDFFFSTYSKSSREKLLEFLAGAPDIESLKTLSQPELARTYAERCVQSMLVSRGPAK
jgi:hypothetical protein